MFLHRFEIKNYIFYVCLIWKCILTIYHIFQSFGELDPFFVATFFDELGLTWEIYDGNGIQHDVEFNGSPTQPLIISGWERLRTEYSWSGNQKLCLFYYGRNQFFLVISDKSEYVVPSFFPPFHTMSNLVGKYQTFFITIGERHVNSSQLVSIFFGFRFKSYYINLKAFLTFFPFQSTQTK
jgi:hypothetical protein